ncbi:hypothetical protein [Sandarakinorhabdus sp.]|uniref:hypothetical protein n=1 Tax=Sandarakinorhabdus sp. TaxID=1916663 RepID=UPI00286DB1B8|nr:hypothetical protein [Sandarakinorhabdus sp.]
MAELSVGTLAKAMIGAAKGSFNRDWPVVKEFAEGELKKLAQTLVQIGRLTALGRVNHAEASVLLEMQKNTARAVMLALQGMSLLMVEQAINAALGAVRDLVNGAIGFALV